MSKCTAAEIAEKKRTALEKLRAKKSQFQIGNKPITTTTTSLPEKASGVFYKHQANGAAQKETSGREAFLNAMRQINIVSYRKEARDSAHPYQRSMLNERTSPISTTTHTNENKQIAPVFVKAITCKVYMISAKRFEVNASGYHAKLIDAFKTIPSRAYDNNTRIWSFALEDYQMLQERILALKPEVVIGAIPKGIMNLCSMGPKEWNRSCLASIESTLADKLLPFQQEGVCFGIAQHGRVMICDEMGLGKTYQALAIADFYREDWPLLICTTASTRDPWSNHVRDLLPSIPVHYVQVLTSNQQYFGDAKVLITSYNMMERHLNKMLQLRFGVLIFDESHTLKNQKAKCTIVADRLAMQAKRVILLSGTPALSRPLELYSQLQMIDRKFMNFIDFTSRYCDGKQTNFGWDATGQSNLQELNVILKLKFMVRRTKADVLPEMAEKFRETVVLDPALVWTNEDTKEALSTVAKHLSASKGREKEEILLRFYAQTAEVKTRAVCAYLKTLVKEKIKFIVFAHHRVMLDAICDCLEKLNVNFIRIDGTTRNDARAEYIKMFQNKSLCQVGVLSLKACNAGITLTAAEMIIFAELDWNPSTLAQAESRAHRIGQDKPVVCRYLMATKTADDVIWNMLKAKQDVLNKAGLFCENLQEATHTIAPTSSKKIDEYFSPDKPKPSSSLSSSSSTSTSTSTIHSTNTIAAKSRNGSRTQVESMKKPIEPESLSIAIDLSKELQDLDEIFQKDDHENEKTVLAPQKLDLSKELANIDEIFNDDDDDAFTNLPY